MLNSEGGDDEGLAFEGWLQEDKKLADECRPMVSGMRLLCQFYQSP